MLLDRKTCSPRRSGRHDCAVHENGNRRPPVPRYVEHSKVLRVLEIFHLPQLRRGLGGVGGDELLILRARENR